MHLNTNSGITIEEQNILLGLAHHAIVNGIQHGQTIPIDLSDFDEELCVPRATFVTLHLNNELRGCIGSLEAYRALVKDVVHNAYAAAFSDPRFPPVREDEVDQLDIHISILNPSEEMHFSSEQDLINQLRPEIDGLIISEGHLRGTFLPSVWESLKEPHAFLQHLKLKAGLPADYWSDSIEVMRYTTTSFPGKNS
ncbi:AmmeMemoRadiSam system protein A [Pseudomonadota bacterium]